MYNPPGAGGIDGDEFEFLELQNVGTVPLELSGLTFTHGINFTFTNETVLGPGEYFVLARNATQFAARYPGAPLNGIYTGKLDNNGENLALSTPLGSTVFAVVYKDAAPWPAEADDSGLSLQRMSFSLDVTTANLVDNDGDGLPDMWETRYGISDPNEDTDHDGLTNYEEFLAGTDPRDEDDRLRLQLSVNPLPPDRLAVATGFSARSNKTYSILYRSAVGTGAWTTLVNVSSAPTNRLINLTNVFPATSGFFRLSTPRLP